jgi:hypothetical protein
LVLPFARVFGPFRITTNPAAITRRILSIQAGRKEPLAASGSMQQKDDQQALPGGVINPGMQNGYGYCLDQEP